MKKSALLFLLIGAAFGALAASGAAQDAVEEFIGGFLSHRTEERFDISIGVTRGGDPVRDTRRIENRETVVVPAHYGAIVTITQDGPRALIWFRDQNSVIRNVVLPDAGSRAYRVQANGKLVAEIGHPR